MNVLLAHNNSIFKAGIIKILLEKYPFAKIEEIDNSADLIKYSLTKDMDLIIVDITLLNNHIFKTIRKIKNRSFLSHMIILSVSHTEYYAARLFRTGISAYLNIDCANIELLNAVEQVRKGEKYITKEIADILAESIQEVQCYEQRHFLLSDLESEIFNLIVLGKNNNQIAKSLALGYGNVRCSKANIMEKLKLYNYSAFVKYAIDIKLLQIL